MTISTYAELKTAVANLLNRSDLTSRIPEWIAGAETRINYGSFEPPFVSEPLRVRAMETSANLTVNGQSVALPTRFLQARRIYLSGDTGRRVDPISPDQFWLQYVRTSADTPREFTIEGENILFGPTPDATYTGKILYYQGIAALSADGDTNWLVTNAPYAYVHGAAIEGFKYLRNFAAAQESHKAFAGIINALNAADKHDRFSGPWRAKTDTGNP